VAQGRDLVWRAWDRELRTPKARRPRRFEWLRFGRRGDRCAIATGSGMSGAPGIEHLPHARASSIAKS
jgi:hypothetical protein